jgi:hypothetical protein
MSTLFLAKINVLQAVFAYQNDLYFVSAYQNFLKGKVSTPSVSKKKLA